MYFVILLGLIFIDLVIFLIGSGNNDLAKFCATISFIFFPATYFYPSIVAAKTGKRNLVPIVALNTLVGWTLVGWIVALIWSLTPTSQEKNTVQSQPPSQPSTSLATADPTAGSVEERLANLKKLLETGVISEVEYTAKRTTIIDSI